MQTKMKKLNKKAFTMIEMLVCLVCLSFVCVGIGSMASAVKQYATYIDDREAIMLGEYQDIMNLKVNGLDFRDKTNYPENIHEAEKYSKGSVFSIKGKAVDYIGDYNVVYTSMDPLIVSVDNDGNCRALYEGVTYIKIDVLERESDGVYRSNGKPVYVPIVVLSEKFKHETSYLKYYLYGGVYYVCWMHDEGGTN